MKKKTYSDTWRGIQILFHRKFRNGFRLIHRHNSEKMNLLQAVVHCVRSYCVLAVCTFFESQMEESGTH